MSEKLDFSLPAEKNKKNGLLLVAIIVLVLVLIISIINLIIALGGTEAKGISTINLLNSEDKKELALKLQNRGLYESAVLAWENYINTAGIDGKEKAGILYTLGKLHEENGSYEKAVYNYYLSESIYKREDLEHDISLGIQESLESMGNFTALRYELTERVGLEDSPAGEDKDIIAEIGTEKITKQDLDRKIENQIDFQLSQISGMLDPAALTKQKEEMFKQAASKEGQMQMLNQYLVEELLYRQAREEGLGEDQVQKEVLKDLERKLLAGKLLNKRKADNINLTEEDLKNYYEVNKQDFVKDGKQLSLEEAGEEVYRALWTKKSGEVEQYLIQELKEKYNVVIYNTEN